MNVVQPSAKQAFLQADIDWLSDTFKVVALDSSYVYSAAHDHLDDVAGGARIATSSALTGKTATDGRADADDADIGAPAAGDTITQLWVYQDTGSEATSRLVAYYDTKSDTTPISQETTGEQGTIRWSSLTGGTVFTI